MKGTIKLLILIIGIVGLCNQSSASYIDSANELANKGVIVNNASNPDAYRIYDKITRGEMAKITINLSGKSFSLGCSGIFSDLKSTDWACKYAESGNFYGFFASNTYFRPNDNITKIEALKMIMQARGIEKSSNSNWQKAYVEGALAKGILKASFSDYNTTAVRGWIFDIATEDIEEENDENTTPESCFEFDKTTGTITRFNCFALDIPERNYPDVVIPSKIGGVTVKSIGDGAFTRAGYFPKTESVVIPDTVTTIGDEAFYGNELESIFIPDSVTYIGKEAFSDNNLEKIYIGKGVKTIGEWAFSYNNLSSVTIPTYVTSIGKGAFYWNPLSKVSKSDYSYIGESAFNNITPESCFEFDENNYTITKYNCQFGSVVVPSKIGGNNVKFISNDVFYVDAIMPDGGYRPFGYRYIIIPDGVGYSGTNGKYYSQICNDSTLNKGGTVIGEICKDYTGNSSVDDITKTPESCFEYEIKEVIKSSECAKNGTCKGTWLEEVVVITGYDENCSSDVVIPNTISGRKVEIIGDRAFSRKIIRDFLPIDEQNLTGAIVKSIVFPDGLQEIGERAFEYNALEHVEIPNSVTKIGDGAFNRNQLKSIKLSNSLTEIGYETFRRNSITHVEIPNSVKKIGSQSFSRNSIKTLILSDSLTEIGSSAFYNNEITSVKLPNSLISIGDDAFYENKIENIEISNSMTEIGRNVFKENQLKSVNIPNSITKIGEAAFYRNELEQIIIPNSVKEIGHSAFGVNKLKSLEIPNSVVKIGDYAFVNNELSSIKLPNSINEIGKGVFHINKLSFVEIPNSVTKIGTWAFKGNVLTSIEIPNSIVEIGDGAFTSNYLTTITIPKSVKKIGDNAFSQIPYDGNIITYNSDNPLETAKIPRETEIGTNAFPADCEMEYY